MRRLVLLLPVCFVSLCTAPSAGTHQSEHAIGEMTWPDNARPPDRPIMFSLDHASSERSFEFRLPGNRRIVRITAHTVELSDGYRPDPMTLELWDSLRAGCQPALPLDPTRPVVRDAQEWRFPQAGPFKSERHVGVTTR